TLNAGLGKSASDSDFFSGIGGNLTVAPAVTVTTGSGGRATLYSGVVNQSTGLTQLIGAGTGRFRYGSDEATQTYLTPLSTGLYAIYRERPTLTLRGVDGSVVYGNEARAEIGGTGLINGDVFAQSVGQLPT